MGQKGCLSTIRSISRANATNGGAIYNYYVFIANSEYIVNCTFDKNTGVNGKSICNNNIAKPNIANCIIWGGSSGQIFNNLSTPTVTYCDVDGGYSPGAGNIDQNPLFNDWEPVSYWRFDDESGPTADDSIGSNDGTVSGATWTNGKVDGALSFNGSGDYVDISSVSWSAIGTGDFTISAWIKPVAMDGDHRMIVADQTLDNFQFNLSNGGIDAGSNDAVEVFESISETFGSDSGDFTYSDDTFKSTSQPAYADGQWGSTYGFSSGGGLKVDLGGIDDADVSGMSGGWQTTFTLSSPTEVYISLQYKLTQEEDYESDEYSQVMLTVDGVTHGSGGQEYVERITGDGEGGGEITTGWKIFNTSLGELSSGSHTLTIGGYNNQKTLTTESTHIYLDDISVYELATDIVGANRKIDGDGNGDEDVDMGAYELPIYLYINPESFNVVLTQGQTTTKTLTITNNGDSPVNYDIQVNTGP